MLPQQAETDPQLLPSGEVLRNWLRQVLKKLLVLGTPILPIAINGCVDKVESCLRMTNQHITQLRAEKPANTMTTGTSVFESVSLGV
jgi:hypothetical protein